MRAPAATTAARERSGVVAALGLRAPAAAGGRRVSSPTWSRPVDGRAAVDGRSVAPRPTRRPRAAARAAHRGRRDPGRHRRPCAAERYATLLDDEPARAPRRGGPAGAPARRDGLAAAAACRSPRRRSSPRRACRSWRSPRRRDDVAAGRGRRPRGRALRARRAHARRRPGGARRRAASAACSARAVRRCCARLVAEGLPRRPAADGRAAARRRRRADDPRRATRCPSPRAWRCATSTAPTTTCSCTTVWAGDAAARLDPARPRLRPPRPGRPLVMGIVNANPDSFSDAVRATTLDAQVELALALVAEGADLIDVGGESGVTYTGVTAAEVERERVVPLVARLVAEGVVVSVDTWKPPVAARRAGRRRARAQRRLGPARPGAGRRRGAHRRVAGRHAHARRAQGGALRRLRRRRRRRRGRLRARAVRASRWSAASAVEQLDRRSRAGLRQVAGRDRRGPARRSTASPRSAIRGWPPSRASTSWRRSPAARRPSAWPAPSPPSASPPTTARRSSASTTSPPPSTSSPSAPSWPATPRSAPSTPTTTR